MVYSMRPDGKGSLFLSLVWDERRAGVIISRAGRELPDKVTWSSIGEAGGSRAIAADDAGIAPLGFGGSGIRRRYPHRFRRSRHLFGRGGTRQGPGMGAASYEDHSPLTASLLGFHGVPLMTGRDEPLYVDCGRHGKRVAAVVCRHMIESSDAVGFVENSSDPNDLQASCEMRGVFLAEGDKTEVFEAFNDRAIVCCVFATAS